MTPAFAGDLGSDPLPVAPSFDPEYFARERERLFRRVWLIVANVQELPNPGDFVVKDVAILNTSILITRGADGKVRAFHNVCKHRGNKVETRRCAADTSFSCGFHGWTYDSQGRLTHVPGEDTFPNFSRAAHGLTPIAVGEWQDFVFVNVDPSPREDLRQFLGVLPDLLDGYPFVSLKRVGKFSAMVNANWKVIADAFNEGLHVRYVHHRSIGTSTATGVSDLRENWRTRFMGRHSASSIYANLGYRPSATESLIFQRGMAASLSVHEGGKASLPKGLNPEARSDWAFDAYLIFPNIELTISKDSYLTFQYWPVAPGKTFFETVLYAEAPKSAGKRVVDEYMNATMRDVTREDLSTVEATQIGIESGAITHTPLSELEVMIRHHRRMVDDYIRA
jgi:phenylpropionate dioxygenase-like ring-hydroxylating dioxygenase large terminal subunit